MKKAVFFWMFVITTSFSRVSYGQDILGGLLGGQTGGQLQGNTQLNGQVGGVALQNGAQANANTGTSLGSQLFGVLRANLNDHATVGQDGTIRFRNDVNTQLQGMGILPNDQLVDANGQPIRDLNSANTFLQGSQNLRVRRNGQIVTIQQPTSQSSSSASQLGWSFGTRNNGVFLTSLVTTGLAAQAGFRAGDRIVSINGNSVGRPEDIAAYLSQANSGPSTVAYVRNGQTYEAVLNSGGSNGGIRTAPQSMQSTQSIQSKLDQIERLVGEIRMELSLAK